MAEDGFDLIGWDYREEINHIDSSEQTGVLGLQWNRFLDVSKVNVSWTKDIKLEKITKRFILSVAHKIFDPVGFTAPVIICPQMMLQKTSKKESSGMKKLLVK